MQSFSSILSLVSLSLLISTASATPVSKRADQVSCKRNGDNGGFIVLSKSYGPNKNNSWDDWIYAALSEDTVTDSNGQQARYLTTKKANGDKVTRADSNFDFYVCDSKYMGYETVNEGKSTAYFGHLAPHVTNAPAKHCLTFASTDINSNSHTLLVDSICSEVDDKSQILNFWSFDTYYGARSFIGARKGDSSANEHYVTISDSGRVHFNPGRAPEGVTEWSFVAPH